MLEKNIHTSGVDSYFFDEGEELDFKSKNGNKCA